MKRQLTNKTILTLTIGLFVGIGISALSIFITEQQVQAIQIEQGDPNDTRIFRLANGVLQEIDQSTYNNGEPVSAGGTVPEIVVFSWSEINPVDRQAIIASAIVDNWQDVTCQVVICV